MAMTITTIKVCIMTAAMVVVVRGGADVDDEANDEDDDDKGDEDEDGDDDGDDDENGSSVQQSGIVLQSLQWRIAFSVYLNWLYSILIYVQSLMCSKMVNATIKITGNRF